MDATHVITMFGGKNEVHVRSLYVGGDIDTRALRKTRCLSSSPLILEAGRCGCAVVFRYGAVVFFELEPMEETAFLEGLRPMIQRPANEPVVEEMRLVLSPDRREGVEGERILISEFSLAVIQVAAEGLARSVVLERFETQVGMTFESLQPVAACLGGSGLSRSNYREMLRRLGDALLDQQEMVGRVSITDKPDTLWDHPELERLHAKLTEEFEILDRYEAVEAKLQLIGNTTRTAIDLVQARRSLRVEWYIVTLIVVEIALTLYEMFVRGY